jgi:hypothetical protein
MRDARISRKGPRNCRSLGFARDDKKERVVERGRIVAKGEGGCWDGGDPFSIDKGERGESWDRT